MGSNWECPPTNRPIHNGLSTIDRPTVRATTTTSLVSTTRSSPSSFVQEEEEGRRKGLGRFGGGGLARGGLGHDVDEVVEELACAHHKRTQGGEAWIHASHITSACAHARVVVWRTDGARLELPIVLGLDQYSLAEVGLPERDLNVLAARLQDPVPSKRTQQRHMTLLRGNDDDDDDR